ncbi:unnamed protein product [Prunus armeniaca]
MSALELTGWGIAMQDGYPLGCKKWFLEGCRSVIGVDGCHLTGPYTGQVLTAVGVDGNNGMFPIAYAVVEAENKSS